MGLYKWNQLKYEPKNGFSIEICYSAWKVIWETEFHGPPYCATSALSVGQFLKLLKTAMFLFVIAFLAKYGLCLQLFLLHHTFLTRYHCFFRILLRCMATTEEKYLLEVIWMRNADVENMVCLIIPYADYVIHIVVAMVMGTYVNHTPPGRENRGKQ